MFTHILQLFFFFQAITASGYPSNCKIAFRLDSVQESDRTATQVAIIDKFDEKDVPLTLAVVPARFGPSFDPANPKILTNKVIARAATGEVEVAFFATVDAQQQGYAQKTEAAINSEITAARVTLLGILTNYAFPNILTLIPPINQFGLTTLVAMKAVGYTTISASAEPNQPAGSENGVEYYDVCADSTGFVNDLGHFPSNVLNFVVTGGRERSRTAADTVADIKTQLVACDGYAVVTLSYESYTEFLANGSTTSTVNTSQIGQLDDLLDELKGSGCDLRLLKDMSQGPSSAPTRAPSAVPINPTNAPTFAPTRAPTNAPTNAPTPPINPTNAPTRNPTRPPTFSPTNDATLSTPRIIFVMFLIYAVALLI